ncbi:FAD-binding oxidoreductase [Rhodococcoides trifolii]|nr:FAD-binding oxidoreductase [Rhodococcus trifolii]
MTMLDETSPRTAVTHQLDTATTGAVWTPLDPQYRDELTGFNLSAVHAAAAVVVAADTADVAAAVRVAAEHGLRVAVSCTGHSAASTESDTVVVSTRLLDTLVIDPVARTATVGSGVRWQPVLDAAAPHGLAALAGSSTTVGVVGYTLGGGLSPVGRTFGYAADHVRSLTLVTGDGTVLNVSPTENAELFWAVRGGGAAFGIVTEIVIDLFPVATIVGGGLFFDAADAPSVLRAWRDWTATVPDNVSTSVAVLHLPPVPELPEPLRGRTVLHLRVAYVGDIETGLATVEPLRRLAVPILDSVGEIPFQALASIHMDPTNPMPGIDRGMTLEDLTDDALDLFLDVLDMPLAVAEIRLMGGALSRRPHHPNAVGIRSASFHVMAVGVLVPPIAEAVLPSIDRLLQQLSPWSRGTAYVNMGGSPTGAAADRVRAAWDENTYAALERIRVEVDPSNRFSAAARW